MALVTTCCRDVVVARRFFFSSACGVAMYHVLKRELFMSTLILIEATYSLFSQAILPRCDFMKVADIIKDKLWPNPLRYLNNEAEEEEDSEGNDDEPCLWKPTWIDKEIRAYVLQAVL